MKDLRFEVIDKDNIVLGSCTDLEFAFQICNMLNMLKNNIENESKTMTNDIIISILLHEIQILEKVSPTNLDRFDFFYGQIKRYLEIIKEFIDWNNKTLKMIDNEKIINNIKETFLHTIDVNKKSCYYYLKEIWEILSKCMFNKKYFIENNA